MGIRRGILWFRNDLRLHDNEALTEIMRSVDEIIPVFVFDDRLFRGKMFDILPKIYKTRALFTIESVRDLRMNLKNQGSNLVVRKGLTEDIIFDLAKEFRSSWVFCNRERTEDEVCVQDSLEESLWTIGQEIRYSRGKMLHYTQDLPFPITHSPDLFATFRKETERIVDIREPLPSPQRIKPLLSDIEEGPIPDLKEFGWDNDYVNVGFKGGETEALKVSWEHISEVKNKERKHLELSPWLSNGALSPKLLYERINGLPRSLKKIKKELIRNLYLRDFHRLMGKKHYNKLFLKGGFSEADESETGGDWNFEKLQQWICGNTEHKLVNAAMKALAQTGYLSHQYRRVVAYYLIETMNVHWLLGAAYFESVLLDYDPCSNYGNWQRIVGVSLDQKGEVGVNFDTVDQLLDPEGKFKSQWCSHTVDYNIEF